jgi:MFS family permease
MDRLGRRLIIVGTLLMSAGMGVMYWVVSGNGHTLTGSDLIVGLALCGLGMGAVAPTLIDVILRGVGHSDAGAASGVLNSALQVGGAVGVALLGTLFFQQQPGRPLMGNDQLPCMQAVLLALVISYAVSAAMAALLLPAKSSGQPERGTSAPTPFTSPFSSTNQRRSKCQT